MSSECEHNYCKFDSEGKITCKNCGKTVKYNPWTRDWETVE